MAGSLTDNSGSHGLAYLRTFWNNDLETAARGPISSFSISKY